MATLLALAAAAPRAAAARCTPASSLPLMWCPRAPLGWKGQNDKTVMTAALVAPLGARAARLRSGVQWARPRSRAASPLCARRELRCGVAASSAAPPRLPDALLRDMLRGPEQRQRRYAPHELLRAAVELDEQGGGYELVVCNNLANILYEHRIGLMRQDCHVPLTPPIDFERLTLLLPPSSAGSDASRAADVASAQQRLLRLLAALEAACPAVLRGRSSDVAGAASGLGERTKQSHIYRRLDTLAAFAVHVRDCSWANAPETWRPPRGKRCVRVRCVTRAGCVTSLLTCCAALRRSCGR
jgi:hypothetical protein